jgi:DNA-binding MarR family transcriptional regulator
VTAAFKELFSCGVIMATFTHRQGQFLAFIHLYRLLHRQGPAELDMVKFFKVTPPSAHGMVVKLEELGLVTRESGVARSIRIAIPEEELPKLEATEGLPW